MSEDRDSGASVVLAFLIGGLAGAAVALLYAPRSGRETRDLLAEKWREGAERGRRLKDEAVARGRNLVDEAGEYVERQKGSLERQKDRLAAAVEAGKQAFREDKGQA